MLIVSAQKHYCDDGNREEFYLTEDNSILQAPEKKHLRKVIGVK